MNTRLTKRETQVMEMIVKGMTSREIAEKLHIAKGTVDNHRKAILKKLDVKNTIEMILTSTEMS